MRVPAVALSLLLVCLPLAASLSAQEATVLTGVVTTRADNLPVPGATVSLVGTTLSTTTDAQGRYSLAIPAGAVTGKAELRVAASGIPAKTLVVQPSGGSVVVDVALSLGYHEEITVGSRSTGAAAEKAVPVDIFTAEQIAAVGSTETSQVIQALAPSFNFPRPTITDGTDTVRPATLRGLGPDQVLVLINGKRRHTSALVHLNGSIGRGSTGVDLNAIPVSAIQRIEVLRDGAAAQYGSDAIAGVINIVLKSTARPLQLSLKGGLTLANPDNDVDGDSLISDGETVDASASYGFKLGRGNLFVSAEYRDRKETNRAAPDPRDQIVAGDARNNPVPQPNHHWGDSDAKDAMGFFDGSVPVSEADTTFLYFFGGFSRREGSHGGFYRRALDARNIPSIHPLGFLPLIEPAVDDFSTTVGVRGSTASRWFWDLSAQYGRNAFDFDVTNSLNVSLGATSPTSFYAGSLKFAQLVGNFDVSREFEVGLAGPLNVAAGLQYLRENYRIEPGEPASYSDGGFPNQFGGRAAVGAQVFPGFQPSNDTDESRDSFAAYLDLEGNVASRLRLGAAGRFERYSDFGSTVDGKLTLRLEVTDTFVIRGAVATGFRAPSLGQSFFSSTATNFLNVPGLGLVPFESLTVPVNKPLARALGAQDLKPEESLHYSGGIVWDPVDDLNLTVDLYRIEIDGRVVLSGNFNQAQLQPILQPFGASSVRFFTNAIDTVTQGVEATASYRTRLASGDSLGFSLSWAGPLGAESGTDPHYGTRIVGQIATPAQLAGLEATIFDRIERRRLECGQPKDSWRATGDWRRGRFSVFARGSRYGEFCSFTATPADDQTFSPEWLFDLELGWRAEAYSLVLGAQNLFDQYPDAQIPVNSFNGIFVYPSHSPFGMNGRSLYAKLTVRF